MSEPNDDECPICDSMSNREYVESMARCVAAIETGERGDHRGHKYICDSATAEDYHVSLGLFCDLLNQLADEFGVDPQATIRATRERINALQAQL